MIRALGLVLALSAGAVRADAVDSLRDFTREAKSGRAAFTQMKARGSG